MGRKKIIENDQHSLGETMIGKLQGKKNVCIADFTFLYLYKYISRLAYIQYPMSGLTKIQRDLSTLVPFATGTWNA